MHCTTVGQPVGVALGAGRHRRMPSPTGLTRRLVDLEPQAHRAIRAVGLFAALAQASTYMAIPFQSTKELTSALDALAGRDGSRTSKGATGGRALRRPG